MTDNAHVVSVQTGREAELPWKGTEVCTAIIKTPVKGAVAVGLEGLAGDEQAGRPIHGGPEKAVCCYPSEHHARWKPVLGKEPPPGGFGENLTLRGLTEVSATIGAVFDIGSARVQISQPRAPCFKLAARWDAKDLPALMAWEGISGWYLRVLREGEITAGDEMRTVDPGSGVTVAEVMRVTYGSGRDDTDAIRRVLAVDELAESWYEALFDLSRARGIALSEPAEGARS